MTAAIGLLALVIISMLLALDPLREGLARRYALWLLGLVIATLAVGLPMALTAHVPYLETTSANTVGIASEPESSMR
jgi:hypothetical protein